MELAFHEKGFTIKNPYKIVQSEKYEIFCVSKVIIWSPKWKLTYSLSSVAR